MLDQSNKHFKQHTYRDAHMISNSILEAQTEEYDGNLTNAQLADIASFSYINIADSLLHLAAWTSPNLQY